MKAFENYLKTKSYSPRTVNDDRVNVERFIKWFGVSNMVEQAELTVPKLLEYVSEMQKQGIQSQTINQRLRSIKKYYAYLESEGHFVPDLSTVKVKGTVKKVVVTPLEYSELEELYSSYIKYREERQKAHDKNFAGYREASLNRKVMIGLMVFQGLRSSDLKRLEINHINDEEGTIYIPASRRSKARQLKLQSAQMRPIFKLLDSLPVKQASLFKVNIDNQLFQLIQELRGLNQNVQDGTHIRASVIMHWLKLHGKRQTQYMIGHKWVSSTEYYERQDLESLTDQLSMYHPLIKQDS